MRCEKGVEGFVPHVLCFYVFWGHFFFNDSKRDVFLFLLSRVGGGLRRWGFLFFRYIEYVEGSLETT